MFVDAEVELAIQPASSSTPEAEFEATDWALTVLDEALACLSDRMAHAKSEFFARWHRFEY